MAKKHLIIGSGKAALSAFEEIRRVTLEDEVKLVSMEDCLPYSPAALIYLLSGRITEAELWMKDEDYLRNMRGTLVMGKKVAAVLPEKRKVIYQDGSSENYDTLLIASGAKATRPPIEGVTEMGTHDFKTLADCRRLLKELKDKPNVAILGAGMTGMKIAAALLEKNHQVSIVEVGEKILPQQFTEEAAFYIRDIFVEHKARFFTGRKVIAVTRKKGKTRIDLSDGSSVETDILINATGIRSRISFLEGTGVMVNDGILTDRRMKTSVDYIYAAGDVVEGQDFFTSKRRINAIIPSAVRQGKIAGANMAGAVAEYEGGIPMAAFNFFGNQAFSIGVPTLPDKPIRVYQQKDDQKRKFKRLAFDGDRLVGAMFLNEKIDPGIALYFIKERINLASHKAALFEGTKPLSNPWLNSLSSF